MKSSAFSLLFFILFSLPFLGLAQDSLQVEDQPLVLEPTNLEADTVLIEETGFYFNPRKAGLYSAIVPGLGQAYNKKYWKIPIVYGGLIGFGYGIHYYNKLYVQYKGELFTILNTGNSLSESGLSESQLRSVIDQARRERDFMIVLTGITYLLNIVDAHIDAHLKAFDLNEELKLKLDPSVKAFNGALIPGISLKLKF